MSASAAEYWHNKWSKADAAASTMGKHIGELHAEAKRLREELALYRQGVIDATLMYPHLYNYLPLYLRELIE